MELSKNFKLEEFACKDGVPVPVVYWENVQLLADSLQVLRDSFNKPIRINSAYRHVDYNRAIGGSEKSRHLTAEAADIVIDGVRPEEIYARIERLIETGKMKEGGMGLYDTFVHYDVRGFKARWNYKTKI